MTKKLVIPNPTNPWKNGWPKALVKPNPPAVYEVLLILTSDPFAALWTLYFEILESNDSDIKLLIKNVYNVKKFMIDNIEDVRMKLNKFKLI